MADELVMARNKLARDIIGEIVVSESPEQVLKKWRSIFGFSQKGVARNLGITSSVISDYESGRRKSPGINMVKKYVYALLDLDLGRGGNVVKTFSHPPQSQNITKAIIDVKEFDKGLAISEFCRLLGADMLTKKAVGMDREIYGYTVIDSVKAISELPFSELINIYGTTTQRALIFTGLSTGRTPMVAIKLTSLHPGLVILHGINQVDQVAINIAEAENIPLSLCRLETIESVIERLKGIG